MLRKLILLCACLCSIPALCESAGHAKYQIATIVAVNPHSSGANTDSSAPKYDVSMQIGNTIYVVLYTPRLGLQTAKYAAGRQVLVIVEEETVTYNDMLGNTVEVRILDRKTVAAAGTR
jgi:hypothetical protein